MGDLLQPWHLIILLLIGLPAVAIFTVPFWLISRRAGLHPAISLLTALPLIGVLAMYYIALAKWPNVPSAD